MLITRDKEFRARLDFTTEEQQKEHEDALAEALTRHRRVRDTACYVLESHHELEKAKREEAEGKERREVDEKLREQQLKNTKRQIEEEEKKAKHEQELQAKETQLEKTRAKAEAAAAETQRIISSRSSTPKSTAVSSLPAATISKPAPVTAPIPALSSTTTPAAAPTPVARSQASTSQSLASGTNLSSTSPLITSIPQRDVMHKQYLQLHQHLKEMRNIVKRASRVPGSPIKDIESKRREMTKLFGQLANAAGDQKLARENQARRNKVVEILTDAKNTPGPQLDARKYILHPGSDLIPLPESEAEISGAFIYLLNFCAKAGVQQMKAAAASAYNSAEPLGISLALIFGHLNLRWRGESFIDILLAKLHFKCPILFGIYGSEKTKLGRVRLGWSHDSDQPNGFTPEQTHYEEMAGIAMGWAALTLRDFKKSKSATNSCPPWHYWRSVACLVNTPPEATTPTHFVVLKSLLENYAEKFIQNYGQAATVAMRKAIVEFPVKNAGQTSGNMVGGLTLLREVFLKKWNIVL